MLGKTNKTRRDPTKGASFVVTFHPKLTRFATKIKELSKYLHIDLKVKTVFTPTSMVYFCIAKKLEIAL